ncbi:MAG: hypothetical protein ACLPXB_11450 [Thiobacillaceae bacterium]
MSKILYRAVNGNGVSMSITAHADLRSRKEKPAKNQLGYEMMFSSYSAARRFEMKDPLLCMNGLSIDDT